MNDLFTINIGQKVLPSMEKVSGYVELARLLGNYNPNESLYRDIFAQLQDMDINPLKYGRGVKSILKPASPRPSSPRRIQFQDPELLLPTTGLVPPTKQPALTGLVPLVPPTKQPALTGLVPLVPPTKQPALTGLVPLVPPVTELTPLIPPAKQPAFTGLAPLVPLTTGLAYPTTGLTPLVPPTTQLAPPPQLYVPTTQLAPVTPLAPFVPIQKPATQLAPVTPLAPLVPIQKPTTQLAPVTPLAPFVPIQKPATTQLAPVTPFVPIQKPATTQLAPVTPFVPIQKPATTQLAPLVPPLAPTIKPQSFLMRPQSPPLLKPLISGTPSGLLRPLSPQQIVPPAGTDIQSQGKLLPQKQILHIPGLPDVPEQTGYISPGGIQIPLSPVSLSPQGPLSPTASIPQLLDINQPLQMIQPTNINPMLQPVQLMPQTEDCCVCGDPTPSLLGCKHPVCGECLRQLPTAECPTCRAPLQTAAPSALKAIQARQVQNQEIEMKKNQVKSKIYDLVVNQMGKTDFNINDWYGLDLNQLNLLYTIIEENKIVPTYKQFEEFSK